MVNNYFNDCAKLGHKFAAYSYKVFLANMRERERESKKGKKEKKNCV